MEMKHHCLSNETLNAALDGMHEFSPAEAEHLESCEGCSLRMNELRRLDSVLTNHWQLPMDKFDAEKIRRHVSVAIANDNRRKLSVRRHYLAWAASFLLVFTSFFVLRSGYEPQPDQSPVMLTANNMSAKNTVDVDKYPFYPASGKQNLLAVQSAQSGSLPLDRLIPVDSSGRNNAIMSYLKDFMHTSSSKLVRIAPQVSQVWTVDNLAVAAIQFERLLDILNLNNGQVMWSYDQNGNLVAQCNITKGELMQLVRSAQFLNWALVSSGSPQPENVILPATEYEPVQYTMHIIQ